MRELVCSDDTAGNEQSKISFEVKAGQMILLQVGAHIFSPGGGTMVIDVTSEICDGVDNDGDGIADCTDPEICDGLDNDGDGLIDEGFPVCTAVALTVQKTGNGLGTVTSNPGGMIHCGKDCTESYPILDTVVTLMAVPEEGFVFTGWSGEGCTGTGTCTVTINASKTITAKFDPIPLERQFVVMTMEDEYPGSKRCPFVASSNDTRGIFSPAIRLSDAGGSKSSKVELSGDMAIVTWEENIGGTLNSNYDVFMARSIDRGATFSQKVNLSRNSGYSKGPQTAILGNTVIIAWEDGSLDGTEIFIARSTNRGQDFSEPMNISSGGGFSPQIGSSGDTVIIVWWDNLEIVVTSTDQGNTFSTPVIVSSNGSGVRDTSFTLDDIQMEVSGSSVVIAWRFSIDTHGFIFSKSTDKFLVSNSQDSGATFSTPINIGNIEYAKVLQDHSGFDLDMSGNTAIVIFWDKRGTEDEYTDIFMARYENAGLTFSVPNRPSFRVKETFPFPDVVISGKTVIVTWKKDDDSIYFAMSQDAGITFSDSIRRFFGRFGVLPSTGVMGSTVVVAWPEAPYFGNSIPISVARSLDGGSTFIPTQSIGISHLKGPGSSFYLDHPHVAIGVADCNALPCYPVNVAPVVNAGPDQQNISSRPRTATSTEVIWTDGEWRGYGGADLDQRTPNLASIVQEIVNRPCWSAGNALSVIITGTGTRTAVSYDGNSDGVPLLYVRYTTEHAPLPCNRPPTAVNDSVVINEDTLVTISVLANDSDPNNDPLTVISVTQPGNGGATINADNTVTYTPNANFNSSNSFTYTVSDGRGGTSMGMISITVNPINDPPVANNQSVTTPANTAVAVTDTAVNCEKTQGVP